MCGSPIKYRISYERSEHPFAVALLIYYI